MSKTITEDINKYMQECSIYKGEDNLIYVGPKGCYTGCPRGEELFSKSNDDVLNVPVFDGDDGIKYITYEDMLNILKLIEERKKEKDNEIERLNKENEELKKIQCTFLGTGCKAEIERLKKREQECIDHYLVQCKYASEMEDKYITANYIINELEKYLDSMWLDDKGIVLRIKDKLQELKGSE